jgi:leucyl aminopeptidase
MERVKPEAPFVHLDIAGTAPAARPNQRALSALGFVSLMKSRGNTKRT